MTEDIVERMRFWSKNRNDNPTAWHLDCGAAANEIERLRMELKVMTDEHRLACEDRDAIMKERDEAKQRNVRLLSQLQEYEVREQ